MYQAPPAWTWASRPTTASVHTAGSKGAAGSGSSAGRSTSRKTSRGRCPVVPCTRRPASSRHHRSSAAFTSSRLAKARPRQNASRTKGIARSTRGLSRGCFARAGSMRQP